MPFELAQPPDHPLLGVIPDRARVDENDIGAVRTVDRDDSPRPPSFSEISSESLTFIWQPYVST